MLPPAEEVARPRKKVRASKPRTVSKRSKTKPQKVAKRLGDETKSADKAMTTKAVAAQSKLMSCDAAAHIVAGYAFSNIKPVNCSGGTYKFRAMREEREYSVTMNANDGNLVEVTKQP